MGAAREQRAKDASASIELIGMFEGYRDAVLTDSQAGLRQAMPAAVSSVRLLLVSTSSNAPDAATTPTAADLRVALQVVRLLMQKQQGAELEGANGGSGGTAELSALEKDIVLALNSGSVAVPETAVST